MLNPQQQLFVSAYTNPKSDTFGNAYRSAKKAGYAEEYCQSITTKGSEWLAEIVRDQKLVDQAEKNIENFLSDDNDDIKIKADITKFTASRLGKKKWSERMEHTGADGTPIQINIVNYGDNNPVQLPAEELPA